MLKASLHQEINIRARAPLSTALTQRRQKVGVPRLPEGHYVFLEWQQWQKLKGRGKSGRAFEGKRKCEYWLTILGEPGEATNFLANLILDFELRGKDMRRSRAAAFFDSDTQAVYLDEDESEDEKEEQAAAEARAAERSAARAARSRSPSCESFLVRRRSG